jgi:hypothetical protein
MKKRLPCTNTWRTAHKKWMKKSSSSFSCWLEKGMKKNEKTPPFHHQICLSTLVTTSGWKRRFSCFFTYFGAWKMDEKRSFLVSSLTLVLGKWMKKGVFLFLHLLWCLENGWKRRGGKKTHPPIRR